MRFLIGMIGAILFVLGILGFYLHFTTNNPLCGIVGMFLIPTGFAFIFWVVANEG